MINLEGTQVGIQIGAKPDSGFDDPIGMLTDCHRRIEHFLNILCVVAGRARNRALSREEVEAIHAALQYFRVGGQRHTADEEESLFPRLRAGSANSALEEIQGLENDHETANGLHTVVESLYLKWISDGSLDEVDAQQLASNTERLKELYAAHIQVEEQRVFPQAARLLDRETVQAIGEEFRARRS
ncbi:MAG: hemerythrin domain-containing protein [Terracidiphilus sp.]|jgi:hemerythrin-like domain-containing protein